MGTLYTIENKQITLDDKAMLKFILAVLETTTQPTQVETLPTYEGAFLKMALTFVAVIVGIIGTIWLMRRLSGGRFGAGSSQSIKIIERKALSPKTMLYIIEVDGKQAVIAESQLEIKRVMDLDSPPAD
jgi:flagellar biogenesis protein FliO